MRRSAKMRASSFHPLTLWHLQAYHSFTHLSLWILWPHPLLLVVFPSTISLYLYCSLMDTFSPIMADLVGGLALWYIRVVTKFQACVHGDIIPLSASGKMRNRSLAHGGGGAVPHPPTHPYLVWPIVLHKVRIYGYIYHSNTVWLYIAALC